MTESNPGSTDLIVERQGQVTWLKFNRPDALNALNESMVTGMQAALAAIEAGDGTRVLVIAGIGRAFCAGADLKRARSLDGAVNGEAASAAFIDSVHRLMNRLESLSLPVIAALNGLTLGAGLEFALCCDLIVAQADARIGDGHARFGLLPGGGGSARLPRRIGAANAKWLLFTGELLPAARLYDWGLVQQLLPAEGFEAAVQALGETVAARSPLGLRRMKDLADKALSRSLDEALAAEREMIRQHRSSRDRQEGLAAFSEKRDPIFNGD